MVLRRKTATLSVVSSILTIGLLWLRAEASVFPAEDDTVTVYTNQGYEYKYIWIETDRDSLVFYVKACRDAYIALAPVPDASDAFEVALGLNTNTMGAIRSSVKGPDVVVKRLDNPLFCTYPRQFWIKWIDFKEIHVGRGPTVGVNELMKMTNPTPLRRINTVGLATGDGVSGRWSFLRDQGRLITIQTPLQDTYRSAWMSVRHRRYVVVGVKACPVARLALSEYQETVTNSYEVIIGGANNTQTEIRNAIGGQAVAKEDTPNILSCSELRFFWLSWTLGDIQVGQGGQVGDKRILSWQDANYHNVSAVGTATSNSSSGIFEFRQNYGENFLFYTLPGYPSHRSWLTTQGSSFFEFRVRGCSYAKIQLWGTPGNSSSVQYEFVLGDDNNDATTISRIRHGVLATSTKLPTRAVLSCNAFRAFWISWASGRMVVGRKSVGEEVILDWTDTVPNSVNALSLSGNNSNRVVEWEFDKRSGVATTIFTPKGYQYEHAWLSVFERTSVVFRVIACSEARVALAHFIKNPFLRSYEVILGRLNGEGAQYSAIKANISSPREDVSETTPYLLKCNEPRYFWVSWANDQVSVGKGRVVGTDRLLGLIPFKPHPVTGVAISTGEDSEGTWEFSEVEGNTFTLLTTGLPGYNYGWFVHHRPYATIQIRACADARIALSTYPGFTNQRTYEITLGAEKNQKSIIRDSNGASKTFDTPYILSCTYKRTFWIKWDVDISVGQGAPFDNVLFRWKPPGGYFLNALSVATTATPGEFTFEKDFGRTSRVYTSTIYGYNRLWITYDKETYVVFEVQACNDAHIALSTSYTVSSIFTYEVVIGGSGNMYTLIRNKVLSAAVASNRTPNVLNCTEFRYFYVSWRDNRIQVGSGWQIGASELVSYKPKEPYPVHAISISTGWRAAGMWQFGEIEDDVITYYSPPNKTFNDIRVSTTKETYSFGVASCSDARVALFTSNSSVPTFEIGIGEEQNQKINIKDLRSGSPVILRELRYPDLLSCAHMRQFWVRWHDKSLEVGRDAWPQHRILEYGFEQTLSVVGLSVTAGLRDTVNQGEWEFRRDFGESVQVSTGPLKNYRQFWLTTRSKVAVVFTVQACAGVSLALSAIPGVTGIKTYEISIGGQNNDVVTIRDQVGGLAKSEQRTPGILICDEETDFWVSWKDNFIEVGKGSVIKDNKLLDWRPPIPHDVTSVAITTDYGHTGKWRFSQVDGHMFGTHTPDEYQYRQTTVTPLHNKTFFAFRVAACRDAHLALIQDPDGLPNSAYEVVIGGWGNMQSAIRQKIDGDQKKLVSTPNILDCNAMRPFWISWAGGLIRVGRGLPYMGVFMEWQVPNPPRPVYAVSMATEGVEGDWQYFKEEATLSRFRTLGSGLYRRFWNPVGTSETSIVFTVKCCGDVRVALAEVPYNLDSAYEVVIGRLLDMFTTIKDGLNGREMVVKYTPGILNCTQTRTLWVSWGNGTIILGTGPDVGQQEVLRWAPPNPNPVNAIAMSSYEGRLGEFEIVHVGGSARMVYTGKRYGYNVAWLSVQKDYVTLKVRACNDAHVLLAANFRNDTSGIYEIVFGGYTNTRSFIRNRKQGPSKGQAETPGILSCDSFRTFWIRWSGGVIRVGSGQLDSRELMSWADPSPTPVNFISVSTGWDSNGEWHFPTVPGETLYLSTTSRYEYLHWVGVVGRSSLVFRAKACNDVHLSLATMPHNSRAMSYELVIGSWQNTLTQIRSGRQLPSRVNASTPGILSCNEFRTFWVWWKDGFISIGRGVTPGQAEVVSWQDPNPHSVNTIGVSTGFRASGEWQLQSDAVVPTVTPPVPATTPAPIYIPGNTYNVFTYGVYKYDKFTMITEYEKILISILACSDAYIALSYLPDNVVSQTYEILIGTDGNTRSAIREDTQNVVTHYFNTPNILKCSSFVDFWISWLNGNIRVGLVDGQQFMNWTDPRPHRVHGVSVATANNVVGVWRLNKDGGRQATFSTPTKFSRQYQTVWRSVYNSDYFQFDVQACSDVSLAFSPSMGDVHLAFEVVIGVDKNTKSTIRKNIQGPGVVTVSTANILSCNESRAFWVGWRYDHLEVGRGNVVGQNRFMDFYDILGRPQTNAVAMQTGWGNSGTWRLRHTTEDSISVGTVLMRSTFESVWMTTDKQLFVFQVRACSEAHIALTSVPFVYPQNSYEIVIGESGNTLCTIRKQVGGPIVQQVSMSSLLSCDILRTFWMSWRDGTIQVGIGKPYLNAFLNWTDPQPTPVSSVSLSTYEAGPGEWEFSRKFFRSIVYQTSYKYKFNQVWIPVSGEQAFVFRVRACAEAHVALAQYYGIDDVNTYEVVIGGSSNSRCAIRSRVNGTDTVSRYTYHILDCYQFYYFWVGWLNGVVEFGTGPFPGQNSLLSWKDPNPHPVNAISFASHNGHTGQFEFSYLNDRSFSISTPAKYEFSWAWLITQRQYFTFTVEACRSAHVALAQVPGNASTNTYEVVIGAFDNGRSVIIGERGGNFSAIENTPMELSCVYPKDYWISWYNQTIQVGRGISLTDVFLSWKIPTRMLHPVNGVAISTGTDSVGLWQIKHDAGRTLRLFTPNAYGYKRVSFTSIYRTSVVFKVKASNDAHLGLFEVVDTSGKFPYEIIIGGSGNKFTVIRNQSLNHNVASAYTPNVLNNTQFRDFWVSWKNGFVEVGRGAVLGDKKIVDWQDTQPRGIHSVGISTGFGSEGLWEFSDLKENMVLVNTYGTGVPDAYPVLMGVQAATQTSFSFTVQACAEVHVTLHEATVTPPVFEFIIGGGGNRYSLVQTYGSSGSAVMLQQVGTPDVLSCVTARTFWLSWQKGHLELAIGSQTGRRLVDTEAVNRNKQIHGISLFTEKNNMAEFQFDKDAVAHTSLFTNTAYQYGAVWVSTVGKSSLLFRVKACSDAHLALAEHLGVSGFSSYEIVIGGWNNQKSAIRETMQGENVVQVVTTRILSCDNLEAFWVSWQGGLLEVGSGAVIGQMRFMFHQPQNPHAVNGISFSTGFGNSGEWELNQIHGNAYTVTTDRLGEDFRYMWMVPQKTYFVFSVMSCKEASVSLSLTPGDATNDAYIVTIGSNEGSTSQIRKSNYIREVSTPNVLNCREMKNFWISWKDGFIQLGSGDLFTRVLVTWQDPAAHTVRSVSIKTYDDSARPWRFTQEMSSQMSVSTSADAASDSLYSRLATGVVGMTSHRFSVQACSGARVALTAIPGNTAVNTYELVIGDSGNKESHISASVQGTPLITVQTQGILDCDYKRSFWVSWANKTIKAGRGGDVGDNTFISVKVKDITVNAVSFATGKGVVGYWDYYRRPANTYTMITPKNYYYDTFWMETNKTSLVFAVKTPNDAHVALAQYLGNTDNNTYEIVLGSSKNKGSVIRRSKQGKDEVWISTPGVVSADQSRVFWISWASGRIAVGTGAVVGTHRFMFWRNKTPTPINYVALSTYYTSSGEWDLDQKYGTSLTVATSDRYTYNSTWLGVVGKSSLQFRVRSCADVHLALSSVTRNPNTLTYEVVIGGWGNTRSVIREVLQGPQVANASTPSILSCTQLRPFWVSWEKGTIRVGRGNVSDGQPFLQWTDKVPHPIYSVGISTGFGSIGLWEFNPKSTVVTTPVTTIPTLPTTAMSTSTVMYTSVPVIPSKPPSTTYQVPVGSTQKQTRPRTNPGQIVGIVFGVFAAILLLVLLVLILLKRRKQKNDETHPLHFSNPGFNTPGFEMR